MITEQGWREVCYKETTLLALMMRMGPRAKDHRWLLELEEARTPILS